MMMKIKVVKAKQVHCKELAPVLRPMDVYELSQTVPDLDVLKALQNSLLSSTKTHAVIDLESNKCVALYGVRDLRSHGMGIPWMLSAEDFMEKNGRTFLKASRDTLKEFEAGYKYLANFIYSKNTVCIRWLEWLGFVVHKDTTHLYGDADFYLFDRKVV